MAEPLGFWRSDLPPGVANELLAFLERQAPKIVPGVMLVCLMITFLARKAPPWLTTGWLALVIAAAVVRLIVIRRLPRLASIPLSTRLNIVAAIAGLNGVVHGLCIVFWPYLSDLQRALLTLIVLGSCSIAIVAGAGYLRAYIAYLAPMLGPVAVAWTLAMNTQTSDGYLPDSVTALVIFAATAAQLIILARDTFRGFCRAYDSRQRLRAALDSAEAANRAKTRFLASASHDLRQPMHTLSLFAEALLMQKLEPESRAIARRIDEALQTLGAELDALLDISKLDAGVVPVRESDFSLTRVLKRIVNDFESTARQKGLALCLECPTPANVRSDPALLERVIRNLVDNALKYTDRGHVRVSAVACGTEYEVVVEDTGVGIPAHEQDRVFDEFYQVDNPHRDRAQGLGLGLSIVKRLTGLLDLSLQMQSSAGAGTRFQLRLPSVKALRPPEDDAGARTVDLRGLNVLVVDDEEGVQLAVQTLLAGFGCQTTLAACTSEAVERASAVRPDIVLVDLRLPGSDDGITAIGALRNVYPGLPALLVSADTAPSRLRQAHDAGVRLLHKPVSAKALTQAIQQEIGDRGERHAVVS